MPYIEKTKQCDFHLTDDWTISYWGVKYIYMKMFFTLLLFSPSSVQAANKLKLV